ncbi:MAG TPA: LURP-one-related family protein [Trebonia sp.]|nr:LURP-one-related family protein [Trebonia sp.]
MRYLVQERLFSITADFWIEDEGGNQVFRVDGSGPFSREAFALRDTGGNLLTYIRKKAFSWRETLQIESEGGLVASVRPAFALFSQRYEIDLASGSELEAQGNFSGKDFEIRSLNGHVYGRVSREWLRMRDTYWVDVPDESNAPLMISIAVCIDRIHEDAEREHH